VVRACSRFTRWELKGGRGGGGAEGVGEGEGKGGGQGGAVTTECGGGALWSRNLGVHENLERLYQRVEKSVGGAHEGLDNLEPVIDTPAWRMRAGM
jgi:hypothetical protein